MEGIVLELEREALDENVSIEVLLRKAYLVARKLKLTDFEEWINNEQNGYVGEVPKYRMIEGEYKALNPYKGWIPVVLSANVAKVIAKVPLYNSISSLCDVYNTSEGSVSFTVGAEFTEFLNKSSEGYDTKFSFYSSRSEIYRIISMVRNKILDWALLLEENEIFGEGMTFTEREKEIASTTKVINNYTNNFYGNASEVDISQG
ncbi:MAG: hypothetical protein ACOX76_04185 [Lachnospiraceae bacterium]